LLILLQLKINSLPFGHACLVALTLKFVGCPKNSWFIRHYVTFSQGLISSKRTMLYNYTKDENIWVSGPTTMQRSHFPWDVYLFAHIPNVYSCETWNDKLPRTTGIGVTARPRIVVQHRTTNPD
jgi:hypothetical protein